jgi:hypothetical protein
MRGYLDDINKHVADAEITVGNNLFFCTEPKD